MFIWQKNGVVRVFKDGILLPTPFLDFSAKVNTFNDNGMWWLTFDPDFDHNGFMYISYVYEPNGNPNDASPKLARLVRVTADPANPDIMLGGSEVSILDNLPDTEGTHSLGTVRFAEDGTMLVGHGDGASPSFVDSDAFGAQDLDNVRGKIFRINPDGTAAVDNPFYDGTDSVRSKVWCYGVRNPYGFGLHPVTHVPYFADVGWNDWEEINRGVAGGNFGWPCYEGNGPQPGYQGVSGQCAEVTSVIAPIRAYSHSTGDLSQGGTCIVGGDFYSGAAYPPTYQGSFFYADYSGNWIHRLVLDAGGNVVSALPFATGISGPTYVGQGPDQMLYYVSLPAGQVRRIRYNGPAAVASGTPTSGYSPLTVTFSSAGSVDAGGGALTYSWAFGDGTTSTQANPTHTYTVGGVVTYSAVLTVRNPNNLTSSASVKVTVGSLPPAPSFTEPADGTGFMPGQIVAFEGSATDPDEGALSPGALSWAVLLHHNTHVHTLVEGTGAQGSFVAENHGPVGSFYYEIVLTATDSSGLTGSTSISLPVIADTEAPGTPVGLSAMPASSYQVNLGWSPSTDNAAVEGYVMERCSGLACSGFVQVGATVATSYADVGLSPATSYSYRVWALDASGNPSGYSDVSTTTTPEAAVVPGLVAAYAFNEGSGTTVVDVSGNSNHGAIGAATWTPSGKYGSALGFSGGAMVTVNDADTLDLTTGMTLEAWVYPTAGGGWRDVIYKGVDDIYYLLSSSDTGAPAVGGTFASLLRGTANLTLNTWSHLAGTYDGATIRLYVNGVQVASRAQTGLIQTSTAALTLGGDALYGQYFSGRMDEVRVYSRSLSGAEIQSDMNTPVGAPAANTAPTISNISDQWTTLNTATSAIAFTVGDVETAAGSLVVSGSSGNTTLVPNANIVFGGSGANRTVTVTPAAGQTGTATITVTVSDGSLTASDAFVLTVAAANTAPTISDITDRAINEDTNTGAISFTVGDVETAAGSLAVSGSSGNTTLVPNGNIVFGGSGAGRTVTVTPAANQSGSATITVVVSDGQSSANDTFVLTVNAVNDPPTISNLSDQVTPVGAATPAIGFTVGDVETAAGSLTVTGSSGNTTLVPEANIVFGGSGANRTVTVTPAAGQTGTATITVTVSDGSLTANDTFVLTVSAQPAALVAAYGFNEGSGTTVADASGTGNGGTISGATWTTSGKFGNALVFNGTSALVTVPDAGSLHLSTGLTLEAWVYPTSTTGGWKDVIFKADDIYYLEGCSTVQRRPAIGGTFSGSPLYGTAALPANTWTHLAGTYDGATLRLYVNGVQVASRAQTGLIGTSTHPLQIGGNNLYGQYWNGRIDEVRVYNRALSAAEIQADMNTPLGTPTPNTAPTISNLADQAINEDGTVGALAFTVGDAETAAGSLTLTGGSSNPGLVPDATIVFGGSGANRTVTVTPAANQSGTATITVTVSDGTLSASDIFILTVGAVNDVPTISNIADQATPMNTAVGPISFTVGDVETAAGSLVVTGASGNTTLVPNANIVFGGSGANRTVTVTPAAGQTGAATITVTVSDGSLTASDAFVLTVAAANTAPTISDITNRAINEDTNTGAISFTVGDGETAAGSLAVSGSSGNPTLVPNGNIVFGGSGASRTVTVTPAANQSGSATITVTVSDGQLSANDTFGLTVNAVNDVPTISNISDQATPVSTATPAIAFTVGDVETAAGSLTVTGSSGNTTLVPNANIVFGGSGANRTVTVTPAAGQTGTATITVTVSDGSLTANDTFVLTVSAQPAGLVAAYGFNEGSGTTVADASGTGNGGTISGASWTTSGKFGNALVFNGTSALVTVPDAVSLHLSTGLTLEAWVYPTSTTGGWKDVIFKGDDIYYLEGCSTVQRRPAIGGTFSGSPLYGTAAVAANTWTHLAGTYDGATLRLYVNGVQVASRAQTGLIGASAHPLQIGGDSLYGQYWNGRIDEVRVYNRALSAAEIQADLSAPLP